jgi:60 kDa SS-A/Ro ribonucleoprotein
MSSAKFVQQVIGNDPNRKVIKIDSYLSANETAEEAVARVLLTGILKNQFYRSVDDITKEALPLVENMADSNPEYLLKAACIARNSHMKGMVKVAIAAINGHANDTFLNRDEIKEAIVSLLATFHPGQLIQFVELCKSKKFGRGFGSRPQKWVRSAMERWNAWKLEENTLKYPTALNQLVRLVHPRFKDERAGLVLYVLDGKKSEATGAKQKVVETLKADTSDKKKIANAILDHKIPWDVIKGFAGLDGPIAMAAMTQMGLTALLLNIRSLEEHNVFSTTDGLRALSLKMDEVKDGRAIPMDFAKPYIYATNSKVKDILLDAMVSTLDVPMPAIEGRKVGVSVDISGSMAGETLKTAGLLAVPFLKANDLWFTTFDTSLYEEGNTINQGRRDFWGYSSNGFCPKLKGRSRKDQVKSLLDLKTAGGTDVSQPIVHAIASQRFLDVMVLITDEQQNAGTPLMRVWNEYLAKVNPRAHLWVINATNSNWHAADFGHRNVTVYQTMTPALFKNLEYVGQDLVKAIKDFDFKDVGKR